MNIKEEAVTMSGAAGTAQQAERSGVGSLADGELTRRLLQRLNGGVDGLVARRPCS